MPQKLLFNGRAYNCEPDETVLSALLRQHVDVPYACQKMSCMTCMMHSLSGPAPFASQKNLKETLQLQNNFLACGCFTECDMEIALPNENLTCQVTATVLELKPLSSTVLELMLQRDSPIDYHGGQSVLLLNYEYIGKPFSIASPGSARFRSKLEVHVERIPGGAFSEWMHTKLKIGDRLLVSGKLFYTPGSPEQPLLLAVWNGGLGALLGLMQDAFEQHHSGPVWLFHGVSQVEDLYYIDELNELAEYFPNFNYVPCVEFGCDAKYLYQGTILEIMSELTTDLTDWKVFLCGKREQVQQIQRHAYLVGAGMKDIYLEVTSL